LRTTGVQKFPFSPILNTNAVVPSNAMACIACGPGQESRYVRWPPYSVDTECRPRSIKKRCLPSFWSLAAVRAAAIANGDTPAADASPAQRETRIRGEEGLAGIQGGLINVCRGYATACSSGFGNLPSSSEPSSSQATCCGIGGKTN
jgi:hypothetical protein